jgi:hypothetical protein
MEVALGVLVQGWAEAIMVAMGHDGLGTAPDPGAAVRALAAGTFPRVNI